MADASARRAAARLIIGEPMITSRVPGESSWQSEMARRAALPREAVETVEHEHEEPGEAEKLMWDLLSGFPLAGVAKELKGALKGRKVIKAATKRLSASKAQEQARELAREALRKEQQEAVTQVGPLDPRTRVMSPAKRYWPWEPPQ